MGPEDQNAVDVTEPPELPDEGDAVAEPDASPKRKRRSRVAELEAELEASKQREAEALERAKRAETRLVQELRELPANGPYRLRISPLDATHGGSMRSRSLVWDGQRIVLQQRNRRFKNHPYQHDPKLEKVVVTDDRALAEYLLTKPFIEIAPPPA